MDLSDRKRKILQAVIDEYIGTAEPVGSRAISKRDNLNLSSATIRNEMADLEDMGYLIQPHTSAGRIPSDEGYRFYVNSLASSLTDYATIITAPQRGESMLRKVDLVPISNEKTTVVVVTETVRSHVINMALSDDECNILATALNKYLKGLTSKDVTIDKMREVSDRIKERTKLDEEVLARVLKFVFETITDDDTEIYVSNMQSILKYPEYRDVNKAGKMFSFLENKDNLRRLIMSDNGEGIHAKIGSENEDEILKDCSLVTVDYSLGDNRGGKISVIGPKRMNYSKVFASLDTISGEIDKILRYYTNNG